MPQPLSPYSPVSPRGAALVSVDGRAYPLVSAGIVARAAAGLALTTLRQEFRNPFDEPLEVVYTLPLPADGAVLGYCIETGESVIRGEIEKREEAQATYEKAMYEGRTAGILDQDREDTFSTRLGSIPPGQAVRVEIEVLHPLGFEPRAGQDPARWEYRFPTVVGVRYQGEPGRVPDADRLDVDRAGEGEIPTRVELRLMLADGSPETLTAVSSTHDIQCAAESGGTHVGLRSGARLDRDLVVQWNASGDRIGARLVEGSGRPGDDGRYALLTLTPPTIPAQPFVRDVTVLLDASGSMQGQPLEWAKAVVRELLQSLETGDRFDVIAFAEKPRSLTHGLQKAGPASIRRALDSLAKLEAGGGTEMAGALVEALEPLREDSQRQVVLVTDGYIGFESKVVGEILRRLPHNARVHAVGVGSAPNRALTRSVARAGRGVEVFACDEASASAAAARACRATVRPVLTELTVSGDAVLGFAPARPCDVLAGQPLVVAMQLKPEGGTVSVSGRQAGSSDTWIWRIAVPAAGASSQGQVAKDDGAMGEASFPLGALYGREVIADLELLRAAGQAGDEASDQQIEKIALRHRIVSRMTSLVGVAETASVDPKLPRRRTRLPVELPANVSAEGVGLGNVLARMSGVVFLSEIEGEAGAAEEPTSPFFRGLLKTPHAGTERWATPAAAREPRVVNISNARATRVTPDGVFIEFETPFDGFVLPDGGVHFWLDDGTWLIAQVVPDESTPPGPHSGGLVVRLALRIEDRRDWMSARSVVVRWLARPEKGAGDRTLRQIVMAFSLPAQLAAPR